MFELKSVVYKIRKYDIEMFSFKTHNLLYLVLRCTNNNVK